MVQRFESLLCLCLCYLRQTHLGLRFLVYKMEVIVVIAYYMAGTVLNAFPRCIH